MFLKKSILKDNQTIQISGSKSISNRLLILQKLFGNTRITNLSNAQDTVILQNVLDTDSKVIDIHHAGTAMRFLTAYYSIQEGKTTLLTGSERMQQRPIQFLVEALQNLGADIEYLNNPGYPPIKIVGKKITKSAVKIPANISSQFISALLLIGGKLENGLQLELIGEITSRPYLEMTLEILQKIGVEIDCTDNKFKIYPVKNNTTLPIIHYEVESDWSSASYFYALAAIGRKNITLKSFQNMSLQGDEIIKKLYWENFGVNTISEDGDHKITLYPQQQFEFPESIHLNMNDCPDIAQTMCVTATALQIPFYINGLSTLKFKETDRLIALQNELSKIGCITEITDDSIRSLDFTKPVENISIQTYHDHRMAMSFAPYCLIADLNIENEDVVEKSYPDFWKDFNKMLE